MSVVKYRINYLSSAGGCLSQFGVDTPNQIHEVYSSMHPGKPLAQLNDPSLRVLLETTVDVSNAIDGWFTKAFMVVRFPRIQSNPTGFDVSARTKGTFFEHLRHKKLLKNTQKHCFKSSKTLNTRQSAILTHNQQSRQQSTAL